MKIGLFYCSLILSLLIIPLANAEIQITSKEIISDVVAKELSQPAKFKIAITNTAPEASYFEFFTFVDAIISPRGSVKIDGNSVMEIEVQVFAGLKLRDQVRGSYTFVYYIKTPFGNKEDRLIIRLLPLKDIITVESPPSIGLEDSQLKFAIHNN